MNTFNLQLLIEMTRGSALGAKALEQYCGIKRRNLLRNVESALVAVPPRIEQATSDAIRADVYRRFVEVLSDDLNNPSFDGDAGEGV